MFGNLGSPQYKRVIVVCGFTDGRLGIDGLVSLIRQKYKLDPFEKGVLFLFCGRNRKRCKGLLWTGDGYVLLTKRLSNGYFCWPRSSDEAKELDMQQYENLMTGFTIVGTIREYTPSYYA